MKPALAMILLAVALHSPKHSEHLASLGKPMARINVIPGFSITNISVSATAVGLSWQGGTPSFYVIGMPAAEHWHVFSGPLTNSRVTFTTNNYRFFRVLGSNGLTNCITILDDDRFGTGRTDVYWMGAWIGYKTFGSNDCAVAEGCASPGYRKLLRFPVTIYNPSTNTFWAGPQGPFYYYDQCHHHFHITNFSAFTLLSDTGVVAGSVKMGWCVRSFGRLVDLGWNTNPPSSSCTAPVLMPGWGDTYDMQDCMWFDVTSLPDGIYTMRVELDPTGQYGFRQKSEHQVSMVDDTITPYP